MAPTTEDNFYLYLVIKDGDGYLPVIESEVNVMDTFEPVGSISFEQAFALSKKLREHALHIHLEDLIG